MRRIWIVLAGLVLAGFAAAAGMAALRGAHGNAGVAVAVYRLEPTTLTRTVRVSGTVAAAGTARLYGPPGGLRLAQMNVRPGQQVAAGQVLVRFHAGSLRAAYAQDAQNLAQAQAALEALLGGAAPAQLAADHAAVAEAAAQVTQAQARLAQAAEPATAEQLAAAKAQVAAGQQQVQSAAQAEASAAQAKDEANLQLAMAQGAYPATAPEVVSAQEGYDQAASSWASSESALAQAEAALAQDQANLAALERQPDPHAVVQAQGAVAQAEATLAQAQARLALDTTPPRPAQVAADRAAVAGARAAADMAAARLAGAVLRAPAAGVVLTVSGHPGQVVPPGTLLVRVAAPGAARVTAAVDETDIARLRVGERAVVTTYDLPGKRFSGAVARIEPLGVRQNNLARYTVEVDLAAVRGLLPGMSVQVRVAVGSQSGVLAVPLSAVAAFGQGQAVWLDQRGRAVRRSVTLGEHAGTLVAVSSGLRPGEELITGPSRTLSTLRPGERVRVAS